MKDGEHALHDEGLWAEKLALDLVCIDLSVKLGCRDSDGDWGSKFRSDKSETGEQEEGVKQEVNSSIVPKQFMRDQNHNNSWPSCQPHLQGDSGIHENEPNRKGSKSR